MVQDSVQSAKSKIPQPHLILKSLAHQDLCQEDCSTFELASRLTLHCLIYLAHQFPKVAQTGLLKFEKSEAWVSFVKNPPLVQFCSLSFNHQRIQNESLTLHRRYLLINSQWVIVAPLLLSVLFNSSDSSMIFCEVNCFVQLWPPEP